MKPAKEVKHWSYSSLKMFEECPARWRYSKLLKLPEPESKALERGNMIHAQMEAYLTGRTDRPRIEVEIAPDVRRVLKKLESYDGPTIEEMWHFDMEWGWIGTEFSYESWFLAKMDVVDLEHTHIVDWKSGRVYPSDHEQQAKLYALAAASRTFETQWRVDMVYLDQGMVVTYEVDTSDLAGAQDRWKKRADKIFEAQKANEFPTKPSRDACKWCPFKGSKGGPCPEA